MGSHTAPRPRDLLVRRLAVPGAVTAAAVTVLAGAGAGVASAHDGQGGHGGGHGGHDGHGARSGHDHRSDDVSDDGADAADPALCDVAGDLGGMGADIFGDTCEDEGEGGQPQDGDGAAPAASTPTATPAVAPTTGPAAAPSGAPGGGAAPSTQPIRPVASTQRGTSDAGSTALDQPGAPGTTRTTPIR